MVVCKGRGQQKNGGGRLGNCGAVNGGERI